MTAPMTNFAVLIARFGDAGARAAFESLVAQLVIRKHGDAREVAVRRGDGGLDVIANSSSRRRDVWQAKFFYPSFTDDHAGKAKRSLQTALATAALEGWALRRWTLCIPANLDVAHSRWWDRLVDEHPEVEMDLWGLTALDQQLMDPTATDLRWAYFELEDPTVGMRVRPPTTVGTADPLDLGVTPAAGLPNVPTYVARDKDELVEEAIGTRPFVLLDGDSAAGKSRTLYELARRVLSDHEIAAPDPTELAGLAARIGRLRDPLRPRSLVLWLDDVDEYLRPGGIGVAVVQHLLREDVKILGTIRRQKSADLRNGGGQAAATLDLAHVVRLEVKASPSEQKRFAVRHPRRRLDGDGIGGHFVAIRRLQNRYLTAEDTELALIEMLVDWRRATGARWMPRDAAMEALRALGRAHGNADEALASASTESASGDRLIRTRPLDLTVPDYLVDFDDVLHLGQRRRAVPDEVWPVFLAVVGADQAAAMAQNAIVRGARAAADAALEVALTATEPTTRSWALNQRGLLETDPDTAAEYWMRALEEGDAYGVAVAARLLMDRADDGDGLDDDVEDRHSARRAQHPCGDRCRLGVPADPVGVVGREARRPRHVARALPRRTRHGRSRRGAALRQGAGGREGRRDGRRRPRGRPGPGQ